MKGHLAVPVSMSFTPGDFHKIVARGLEEKCLKIQADHVEVLQVIPDDGIYRVVMCQTPEPVKRD